MTGVASLPSGIKVGNVRVVFDGQHAYHFDTITFSSVVLVHLRREKQKTFCVTR
jgi:hypothetical protein